MLLWNWFGLEALSSVGISPDAGKLPLVSICIPARNEESVIDRCITSALKQNYPSFEVLVLDDNSTDRTSIILEEFSDIIANLHHLDGKPKPDDWLGKPWACHQLSEQAKGEYLIFIDADVWLEEDTVSKTIKALDSNDAITVWPKQHFGTFWEAAVLPLVYYSLYTLLPAKYVEQDPKWLPKRLQQTSPEFAAACGQFIAFTRSSYKKINGHKSVKDEVLEDVELGKNLKRNKCKLKMFQGVETVNCRMYQSHSQLWQGFRKNFFAGFGNNALYFITVGLLHLIVFVLPFAIAALALLGSKELLYLSFIPVGLIIFQRLLIDFQFKWNPLYSLLHPIGVLWFQALAIRVLYDYYTGKKASWKGRYL